MSKSYLNLGPAFPIGIRRNNPGNLAKGRTQYPGVTDRPDTGRGPQFFAFVDMAHGIAAMITLVQAYITSKGLNTIRKLATRYAPPREGNNTPLWIRQVSQYSGIPADKALTTDPLVVRALVLGIIKKEVGLKFKKGAVVASITLDDYSDAAALLAPAPLNV